MCLFFVESDVDVKDTENMHCAKSPDTQDDRICSYSYEYDWNIANDHNVIKLQHTRTSTKPNIWSSHKYFMKGQAT